MHTTRTALSLALALATAPLVAIADAALPLEVALGDRPAFDDARGYGFDVNDPARFSIRLPEGSYLVTLTNGNRPASALRVWSEQRRLMVDGKLDPKAARRFVANVRRPGLDALPANATGGSRVLLKPREVGGANWDDRLTLEFAGDASLLRLRIEPAVVPTLYLAGDSTVTDQSVAPDASWGQMLPVHFSPTLVVANHAESGETLKSFVTELRLAKLLSALRAGDWVMIQFGHNDQKAQWPQTYADAATTYRAWLRTYIAEVRARGATPILVTSPDRRNFDAHGRIESTLGEYPEAMRIVGREENVAVIDLNAMSREYYESLGPERAAGSFADDGRDKTHFNETGAIALARCIVTGIRAADLALMNGLARHLAPGAEPH
jgi:lysophospholipase L1-like esterase